jgi:hypothetical protein
MMQLSAGRLADVLTQDNFTGSLVLQVLGERCALPPVVSPRFAPPPRSACPGADGQEVFDRGHGAAPDRGPATRAPPPRAADVQAIAPKDGGANPNNQRFKLTVSDGVWTTNALLASQLKEKVDSGAIQKGTIIDVTETVSNGRKGVSSTSTKKWVSGRGRSVRLPSRGAGAEPRGMPSKLALALALQPAPAPPRAGSSSS